jgi:hypothetical protein
VQVRGLIRRPGELLGARAAARRYAGLVRQLLTLRWLVRHLAMLVVAGGCVALGVWQVHRAAQGNLLSYGYAVEWPVFAGFAVFIWYRELRMALGAGSPDQPSTKRRDQRPPEREVPADPRWLSAVPPPRNRSGDSSNSGEPA